MVLVMVWQRWKTVETIVQSQRHHFSLSIRSVQARTRWCTHTKNCVRINQLQNVRSEANSWMENVAALLLNIQIYQSSTAAAARRVVCADSRILWNDMLLWVINFDHVFVLIFIHFVLRWTLQPNTWIIATATVNPKLITTYSRFFDGRHFAKIGKWNVWSI